MKYIKLGEAIMCLGIAIISGVLWTVSEPFVIGILAFGIFANWYFRKAN